MQFYFKTMGRKDWKTDQQEFEEEQFLKDFPEEIIQKQELSKEQKIEIIKESIRVALKISDKIKPTDILVLTLFNALQDYFINGIKYVIAELPTGSGKSVIGYLLNYCFVYCNARMPICHGLNCASPYSYFLTSSKLLQKQIEDDFERFNISEEFKMLKGTANYECLYFEYEKYEQDQNLNNLGLGDVVSSKPDNKQAQKIYYDKRFCMGFSREKREKLNCNADCPYLNARAAASKAQCAVLNYAYFLNILRSENMLFGIRPLTICDEAHLIPDITCNMFELTANRNYAYKGHRLCVSIKNEFDTENVATGQKPSIGKTPAVEEDCRKAIDENIKILDECYQFFDKQLRKAEDLLEYYKKLKQSVINFGYLLMNGNSSFKLLHEQSIRKLFEGMETLESNIYQITELLKRPNDIYIKSEIEFGKNFYTHVIKDMSERETVRKNFLAKTEYAFFMSATLGNMDEYAYMVGLNAGEYKIYRINSTFDFSTSPIYLTNSGWLNYQNFKNNIDDVLNDCIYICKHLHPNEYGIIHTSTFNIASLLMDKIRGNSDAEFRTRFLTYKTPLEKEQCIKLLKESEKSGGIPYVIVGASLYEGLDLKYDQGRFNIMIKVPYPGIDDYVKQKMERMPFWYGRITLEKIVQAIGRTNRAPDDSSKVYLLDSSFRKQINLIPGEVFKNRMQTLEIPREQKDVRSYKSQKDDTSYLGDILNQSSTQKTTDDYEEDDLPF